MVLMRTYIDYERHEISLVSSSQFSAPTVATGLTELVCHSFDALAGTCNHVYYSASRKAHL